MIIGKNIMEILILSRKKFPDPAGMIERLHKQGFKVMVWISPFVSADSPESDF